MVFVKCDRCGQIVNKRIVIFNQTDESTREEMSEVVGVPIRHWDLCEDCWNSYCKWLLNDINDNLVENIKENTVENNNDHDIDVIQVNDLIATDITSSTSDDTSKKKSKNKIKSK